MNINDQLSALYERWLGERNYSSFIKGGVVDPSWYNDSKYKVLYLLKEANTEDSFWSQVDLLTAIINKERTFYEIFKTISLLNLVFFQGLNNYATNLNFGRHPLDTNFLDSLSSIAITNIKKEKGGRNSDWNDIFAYATRDKEYIEEEIELMNPDIVVCCGTFEFIEKTFELQAQECGSGAKYDVYRNRVYIDIPHPKAFIKRNILYTYFKETISELMSSKIIK